MTTGTSMKKPILNITIGEILNLKKASEADGTIGTWKLEIKKFALDYGVTDREAIAIGNINFGDRLSHKLK